MYNTIISQIHASKCEGKSELSLSSYQYIALTLECRWIWEKYRNLTYMSKKRVHTHACCKQNAYELNLFLVVFTYVATVRCEENESELARMLLTQLNQMNFHRSVANTQFYCVYTKFIHFAVQYAWNEYVFLH